MLTKKKPLSTKTHSKTLRKPKYCVDCPLSKIHQTGSQLWISCPKQSGWRSINATCNLPKETHTQMREFILSSSSLKNLKTRGYGNCSRCGVGFRIGDCVVAKDKKKGSKHYHQDCYEELFFSDGSTPENETEQPSPLVSPEKRRS